MRILLAVLLVSGGCRGSDPRATERPRLPPVEAAPAPIAAPAPRPFALAEVLVEPSPPAPPKRVAVRLVVPTVCCSLPDAAIRRVVHQHEARVRRCLDDDPALSGPVPVTFTIAPEGRVTAGAGGPLPEGVRTCVADALRAMVFPSSAGALHVSYVISAKSGGPGRGFSGTS